MRVDNLPFTSDPAEHKRLVAAVVNGPGVSPHRRSQLHIRNGPGKVALDVGLDVFQLQVEVGERISFRLHVMHDQVGESFVLAAASR